MSATIHILLADDDPDDREFFAEAIQSIDLPHKLTMFEDGQALMDYLSGVELEIPHILFLDLNMPCKSGFDCLDDIRKNDKLRDLSVAIYSTSSSERDVEEAFVGGANIYIKKPSDFQHLKKMVSDVVKMNWQYHNSGLNRDNFLYSIQ
ncbi:MAG TPA: response regulator [Flavobacterium sp.]|nr:response regulator [Flavobacterium sp.]